MYNPNNYDLPDYRDKRLTDYVYSYDVLFNHAVAFSSDEFEETPWIDIEFETPFRTNTPFHFLMWPDTPTIIEAENVFDLEQLDSAASGVEEVERRITELMKYPTERAPDLDEWYERAQEIGADRVGIIEYRVRYTWRMRAWDGLNLEYLESQLDSTEDALEFSKYFVDEETFVVLATNEPDDPNQRPAQLVLASEFDETEFEDPSKPAGWSTLDLSDYTNADRAASSRGIGRLFSAVQSLFRR